MKNRSDSLDWLRGLMAISIMLYHYGDWHDAGNPLGRLGIYGVSIFFILSGLSMAIAYEKYINGFESSINFFIRRIFRIWPLLWLSIFLVAVPSYISGKPLSASLIIMNATTMFGFIAPTQYINMGAWSIGNEMVYYALTPFLISAYNRSRFYGNAATGVATAIGIFFAFTLLSASTSMDSQWSTYINPLNNLWLYCAGVAIYYNMKNFDVDRRWNIYIFISAVCMFFVYPCSGNQINLVVGFNRIAMSAISIFVVMAFYKCSPRLPKFIGQNLEKIGVATYGIYLLHPIVIGYTGYAVGAIGIHEKYVATCLSVVVTIFSSIVIFRIYEYPMIKIGKKVTQGIENAKKIFITPPRNSV